MKIVVISDLHIDINRWHWNAIDGFEQESDTVVVAGDISNDVFEASRWIADLRSRFTNVVWVAGNHDFYNLGLHQTRLVPDREWAEKWPYPRTVDEIIDHYQRWSDDHGITFLHRRAVEINGVTFIGATGWHDYQAGRPYSSEQQIEVWYNVLNDTQIRWRQGWEADHLAPMEAGIKDANAIEGLVMNTAGPQVVVTHHIPHRDCLWHRPENPIWTMLHGSFANTRMERISDPRIRCWIYGHTHQRGLREIGGVAYVCNARGYPGENDGWQPVVIDI